MSGPATGFATLRAACQRLAVTERSGPARIDPPDMVLAQALEPSLHALYQAHDGVWWSSPTFSLRIYPLQGPDALEWRNVSLRRSAEDFVPPYHFDDLLVFAQYGWQASYLAAIPALASASGLQPVIYLDTHEDPWAVPIASSIDGAFTLLARYLDQSATTADLRFPLDIPELISPDKTLTERVRARAFETWTRGDQSIQDWIQNCFGGG